jgi:hypothetical protein
MPYSYTTYLPQKSALRSNQTQLHHLHHKSRPSDRDPTPSTSSSDLQRHTAPQLPCTRSTAQHQLQVLSNAATSSSTSRNNVLDFGAQTDQLWRRASLYRIVRLRCNCWCCASAEAQPLRKCGRHDVIARLDTCNKAVLGPDVVDRSILRLGVKTSRLWMWTGNE